ncbi:hypothetical protein TNCV_4636141 [Trichonephila clavipes]|uniref:Uncharacterized protein n=1 Tax=Trichonephila clavipes TaxID=2585209 RepID=A0A8X6UUX9_TRICX|nr:hypothetical protein TNCV_4636141 [Trichonephila clavipes]
MIHLHKASDNLLQRIQKTSVVMTHQVQFSMTQILTNVHPERVHHSCPEQNDSGREIGEGVRATFPTLPMRKPEGGGLQRTCFDCSRFPKRRVYYMCNELDISLQSLRPNTRCLLRSKRSLLILLLPNTPCQCSTPPPSMTRSVEYCPEEIYHRGI